MNVEELIQILACPKCRGDLTVVGSPQAPDGFACANCRVIYPIRDEIPILLPEESIPQAEWKSRAQKGD